MVHLNSLQVQVYNLRFAFEDELVKEANIEKIKTLYGQIKGLDEMIAKRKGLIDGEK